MSTIQKEATLTGRVVSLARHPMDAGKRAKLDKKVSEALVRKINIPLYKKLVKGKKGKKSFSDRVGDVANFLGIGGEPGKVGPMRRAVIGKATARTLADNPELALGYTAPVPYVGTALAVGKKRLYKLLGAKTPAQVRREMRRRNVTKSLLAGGGIGGAAGLIATKGKKKNKLGPHVPAMGDELKKIAEAMRY